MKRIQTKEKIFMGALALLVVGSTIWMSYVIISGKVTANDKLTFFVMGYIMGQSERVLNYYFGSSKGSSDKTDIISGLGSSQYVEQQQKRMLPPSRLSREGDDNSYMSQNESWIIEDGINPPTIRKGYNE